VSVNILLLIVSTLFLGCASTSTNSNGVQVVSQSEYEKRIKPYSKNIETYRGLINTLHMNATLLNSQVIDSQILQRARLYQWNAEQLQSEREKLLQDAAKQTSVFVSLYTPDRKHDDLHKNKTLWKIFLDVQGRRFEGRAEKIKLLPNEIQALYPDHTRFATPYMVRFPVSTSEIEGQSVKFTVTGTVSSATLEW
jgi:hypothetical protein